MLKKMLPPNNEAIAKIAKDEGITVGTLYSWREQAGNPPANVSLQPPTGFTSLKSHAIDFSSMRKEQNDEHQRQHMRARRKCS